MTKKIPKIGLAFFLLSISLSSCVNLKHVNDFSSSSTNSIKKFEELNYTFTQNCVDNCYDKKINDFSLDTVDCNCNLNEKADSITQVIYNSVRGYFEGLSRLSNNNLTNYKLDNLTNALTEGEFGSVKIEKQHIESYSKISKILLKSFTDEYRKKKIKQYVIEANQPIKILLSFLEYNLSSNLTGNLKVQKMSIKEYSFELLKNPSLSKIEKRKVIEEYYERIKKIESTEKELITYTKSLKKISDGHQKLADNIGILNQDEIKLALTQYASDIQDIISEFNKIKK